jgi:Family of unknown function (DUF6065)
MKLECFPMAGRPPEIVPGRPNRDWMDAFDDRHAYRCLPMTMANTTGWEILCPVGFWAEWNGGPSQNDITFRADHPYPDFTDFVKSHFSQGIMTFHTGYMFRTPERWSLWTGGPPNHVKDGIAPLCGIVETDWLPFPFTMNWRFTRPGRVYWAKGEPFCFIMPIQDKALEEFDLVQRSLEREPELSGQFDAWTARRAEFNDKLFRRDPETVREAWQRYYFKGEMPDDSGPAPKEHVNKRRLRNLRLGA